MLRNLLFMIIGIFIGAGVIYIDPSKCEFVIDQTQGVVDNAQGWIANRE